MRRMGHLFLHLLSFLLLRELVFALGSLSESHYERDSLLAGVATTVVTSPFFWAFAIGAIAFRSRALASWQSVEIGRLLKWLATALALMLAVTSAGQPVNLYFGQEYLLDRTFLLILAALVWFRPIIILPFVVLVVAVAGQFAVPVDGYGWDRHLLGVYRLPIHLLLIILCGTFAGNDTRPAKPQTTVTLAVVAIAACYWVPGFGKLRIGYLFTPNVHYSVFGAWAHGWLADLSGEEVVSITTKLKPFAIPLQFFVMLIECGALFILVRRVSLWLLPMWVLFHLGAWILYGYIFWVWILIDVAVFWFILKQPEHFRFDWKTCVLAFVLVGTSRFWLNPNRLAWFNSPLANTYQIEATTSDGETIVVNPSSFAPYDYIFTMQMFAPISSQPQLTAPYGATSVAKNATAMGSELAAYESRKTQVVDPVLRGQLSKLIRRYAESWNAGRDGQSALAFLHTPALLNTTLQKTKMAGKGIVAVKVVRVRSFLATDTVVRERVEECLVIDLNEPPD